MLKLVRLAFALASLAVMLVLAAPATASTQTYHATFVEIDGGFPGGSCGSATISRLGHVADQCVFFDACGPNCEVRTITVDDGSTLVIQESIVGADGHFLYITQTIVGGTGRFEGATGSGTGRVNLAAGAVITASGTITFP